MPADAWITLAVIGLVVAALVRDVLPPAAIVLTGTILLLVAKVIDAKAAFSGFSNQAPITVAALYVVSAGIDKTGLVNPAVATLLGRSDRGRWTLGRLIAPTAGVSAFLNNTPVVATMMPVVDNWASRNGRPVSRFLMPLSFAAILGGVVTTIGTSTNLVVSGLLEDMGQPGLKIFDITPVGLPVALAGLTLMLLIAPRLLPDRLSARAALGDDGREFVVQMVVQSSGPLDGATVAGGGLRHLEGVFLVEARRGEERIAPVTPDTVLRGGDVLSFAGKLDLVVDLQRQSGLVSAEHTHVLAVEGGRHTFYEAVVGPGSPLVGRTLREVGFRARYQAAVVGIHRSGHPVDAKFGEVVLRVGDTLLLLAGADFKRQASALRDFLVVVRLDGPPPTASRKAPLAGVILAAVVGAAAFNVTGILEASLIGALATVALGVLTAEEARDAVDLEVIVLIAASFGLGAAAESSGLAQRLADGLVDALGGWGHWGVMLGIVVATVALTELITNNAAAVLVFPIAMAAGTAAGFTPMQIAVAVAIAASASFLTPIGYQTNTMVYGPGGYRFGDYVRLGLPITVLVMTMVVILVPRLI